MSRFSVEDTPLAGLKIICRHRRGDERGWLVRLFCKTELSTAGWRQPVAQANLTRTKMRGSVRGLHFQHPPHAEMKLVSCVRGAVWDVAVDLRHGSPTFLRWHAEELSEDNDRGLLIPEGFAHGFQTLTDEAELLYLHSSSYQSVAEGGLAPFDPALGIAWPEPVAMISDRDRSHPPVTADFSGISL